MGLIISILVILTTLSSTPAFALDHLGRFGGDVEILGAGESYAAKVLTKIKRPHSCFQCVKFQALNFYLGEVVSITPSVS